MAYWHIRTNNMMNHMYRREDTFLGWPDLSWSEFLWFAIPLKTPQRECSQWRKKHIWYKLRIYANNSPSQRLIGVLDPRLCISNIREAELNGSCGIANSICMDQYNFFATKAAKMKDPRRLAGNQRWTSVKKETSNDSPTRLACTALHL